MGLDLRFPIGIMFSLVGLILLVYGLMTSGDIELYRRSLGININQIWGGFLLIFGSLMLGFALKGAKSKPEDPKKQ
ncbi:MAG: hypothetical protein A2283_24110 [Lentisphaerae bacterium RIFOXYA12_FULL_48_11]|nr:MAG: hypothetical protein A2283_24110 [Lentisphaerae bacterium RIFOXYA12_FULL_48_11]